MELKYENPETKKEEDKSEQIDSATEKLDKMTMDKTE